MQKLLDTLRKHWVVAVLASIGVGVAAIVAFLSGVAAIWGVMSRDTVPEFLEKQGWLSDWTAMTVPPLLPLTQALVSVGVLVLLVGLWRVARKPRYPVVFIFEHKKASPELVDKVRRMYQAAEYTITNATSDLPQHANGVWLRGGTNSDREHAKWGLARLGIEPKPDYSGDVPEHFQVIVGEVALAPKPVTNAPPLQPDPQVMERKAKELERIARDMAQPVSVSGAIRRQFEDEAENLREAAQSIRKAGAESPQERQMRAEDREFETTFVKAVRQSERIEIDWRKTDTNLMVSATNRSGDVVEGFELWVDEPLRFADGKFVKQKEFQDYRPTRLTGGSSLLYHGQPEPYPFLSYATDRLLFSGASIENPSQQGNFRTVGIWKIPFRTELDGISRNYELFFDWTHTRRTIPNPCDDPSKGGANGTAV